MNLSRAGWLASLVAVPLASAQRSHAQEPLGLSAVQRPFQSADKSITAVGKRFTFVCPASDGANATVYGTDLYTGDSAVCAAAIHAGVLASGQAGVVTVVMGAGAEAFRGSSRNGVTTRSYGPWDRSYTFARDGVPGMITWRTVWSGVPDDFVAPITVECPANGTTDGKIWGTDVYTRDTVVCLAAAHAGAITVESGGVVVVTRAQNTGEFTGSVRNAVTSQSYGPYRDAFTLAAPQTSGRGLSVAANSAARALAPSQPSNGETQQPRTAAGQQIVGADGSSLVAESAGSSNDATEPRVRAGQQIVADGRPIEDVPAPQNAVVLSNPTSVSTSVQGADVVVSWSPVSGASWYGVTGQQAGWRQVYAPTTSITYQGLPPGQYVFSVGAYFEPGPQSTPDSLWPTAIATVAPAERSQELNEAVEKAAKARQEAQDAIRVDR